jgi:serine phosphatase RsbU (regulator of sigma subunit)
MALNLNKFIFLLNMNKIFALLFFIIYLNVCNSVFCQDKVNVLQQKLKVEKNPMKQIDLLIELSKIVYYTDFNEALNYAQKAKDIIDSQKLTLELKGKKALTTNIIGVCYLKLGKHDKAIKYCLQSLNIAEEIKDSVRMGKALNNLGMIYGYKKDYNKSNDYFLQSAVLSEQLSDFDGAAISYSNVSASYYDLADKEKGDLYYDKSMRLYKQVKDDYGIASLYLIKGNELYKKEEYKKALKFYDLAESIFKDLEAVESLDDVYQYKAQLYNKVDERKKAIEYSRKSIELAKKLNSPHSISLAYLNLSSIYEKSKDMGKALDAYKLYVAWKDSVFNQKSESLITEMQAKYNFEKEERENKILKQEASIAQLEIENKEKQIESSRIIIISIVGGGVLLILLAFVLYKQNKLKEQTNLQLVKVNNEITEAKQIIEEKNKDITSSIQYAKYIQQAILPKKESINKCFSEALLLLLPKDVVSGDFYWFQKYGKYSILVLSDCTGHGVPGGFMSMMGVELLNQVLGDPTILEAGKALEEIDKRIRKNLNHAGSERQQNDGMDMAICIFDTEAKTLQYAGANSPLVVVRDGKLERIVPDKYGVGGAFEQNKKFTTHHLSILKNDLFYMYSDGFPDQFGGTKNKKFMRKRLLNLFLTNSHLPMHRQKEELLKEFYAWKGNLEQIDDVSIVGVRV